MIFRSLLLLALALGGLNIAPKHGNSMTSASMDDSVLVHASVGLKHTGFGQVLSWLRHQPSVAKALVGRDGRTVDIRFRDGTRAAILPARMDTVRLPGSILRSHLWPSVRTRAPGGRALVLEPFATQLGLGPTAGDVEVNQLRAAGFQVDQLYDADVSVSAMSRISEYNVTYMHTHSGTNVNGAGVVATGQIANDDPAVAPLVQNGSVIKITVSGSHDIYYGITPSYINAYEGQFPTNSLLFLNGCDMLQAPYFMQALQAKGLGVLVSWDKEARSADNYLAGAWFFAEMNQGLTVANAVAAVRAAGYGTSKVGGETATLGYLGNGQITLRDVPASPPASNPTPATTATSGPAEQPTVTPTPAPTATPTTVPGPPLKVQLKHRVKPGSLQVVTITSSPDTILHIRITFPSGDSRTATTATDGSGVARYVFPQHSNRITRKGLFATVTVEAVKSGGVSRQTMSYRIGWSPIDVSIQPSVQAVGRPLTIWVHTAARTQVIVALHFPRKGAVKRFRLTTGARGWTSLRYTIGRYLKSGANHTVRVQARTKLGTTTVVANGTFRIV